MSYATSTAATDVFTRAARVLDAARARDPATAHGLREPHVALDAYGRILGISEPFAERLGFRSKLLIGRRLLHRVVGIERIRFRSMLTPVRSGNIPQPLDLRLRAKNEKIVRVALAPVAITQVGGTIVVVLRVAFEGAPVLDAVSNGDRGRAL